MAFQQPPAFVELFTGSPDAAYVTLIKAGLLQVINNLTDLGEIHDLSQKAAIQVLITNLAPLNFVDLVSQLESSLPESETGHIEQHARAYAAFPWYAAISDFYTVIDEIFSSAESEGGANLPQEDAVQTMQLAFQMSQAAASAVVAKSMQQSLVIYQQVQKLGITAMLNQRVKGLVNELYPLCLTTSNVMPSRLLIKKYNDHLQILLDMYASLIYNAASES